jgi:hypothetical protein
MLEHVHACHCCFGRINRRDGSFVLNRSVGDMYDTRRLFKRFFQFPDLGTVEFGARTLQLVAPAPYYACHTFKFVNLFAWTLSTSGTGSKRFCRSIKMIASFCH